MLVPVKISWQAPDGTRVREDAQAREVNTFGGLIETKSYPPHGAMVELTNPVSEETQSARVVSVRRAPTGEISGVAVELFAPSETFWGVTYRLKRTSAELLKLEEAIKLGDIDPRVIQEFRDAVDYVRRTAWVVQEWQERRVERRDTANMLTMLTSERIRRMTQLTRALAAELESRQITDESPGIGELSAVLEGVVQRLAALLKPRS